MRRLFLCLLLALCLLTGCSSQSEMMSTEPDVTPPPEASATEPVRLPTAGGVTVQTDYSHYQPHEAAQPVPRLSEEFIPDLLPSDDYGAIYPFVGDILYSGTEDGYTYPAGSFYGLIDAKGRIIADPVYTYAAVLRHAYNNSPLSFWLLQRTGNVEKIEEEYGSYFDADTLYGLASLDGSFATGCIYSEILGCDGGYALALRETESGALAFELFDPQGGLALSSDSLPFRDRLVNEVYLYSYGDGLLTVAMAPDGALSDTENDYYTENYDCYYIDLQGNFVAGPYAYAGVFFDGYAAVQMQNGDYNLIDKAGNPLIDRKLSWVEYGCNTDGFVFAVDAETETNLVLDREQILLETVGDQFLYSTGRGFEVDSGDEIFYYDGDGALLYGGAISSDSVRIGESDIFYRYDFSSARVELKNYATGAEYTYYAADYPIVFPEGIYDSDGRLYFCMEMWDSYREIDTFILFDSDLNELLSGDGSILSLVDDATGIQYLAVDDYKCLRIFSTEMRQLCEFPCTFDANCFIYDGRIVYSDSNVCAHYDLNGTLLFRYTMASAMGD